MAVRAGMMNSIITFQRQNDAGEWVEYLSAYAYINGVSGSEFYIANAGGEAALMVTIQCRYQAALMRVTPMRYRAVSASGIVYDLISPGDDIQLRHREIKFRAKRVYSETDGLLFEEDKEDG